MNLYPSFELPPSNEHPVGVGVETQGPSGRNYIQRQKEHFSEDARRLLFSYAQCEHQSRKSNEHAVRAMSNTEGDASGDEIGHSNSAFEIFGAIPPV